MYNLTRYQIGDRVILGKTDKKCGYPNLEATIVGKAPKMVKVSTLKNYYWGEAQERWLSADEYYVVVKIDAKGE